MASLGVYCATCSLCCRKPFVLPEERAPIAKRAGFLKRRRIKKEGNHYVIEGKRCPFLKKGLCSIEDVKPLGCRVFPLVLERDGSGFVWTVSAECPRCNTLPEGFREKAMVEGQRLLQFHNFSRPTE
jgi:Fe-S-cluster containining protein